MWWREFPEPCKLQDDQTQTRPNQHDDIDKHKSPHLQWSHSLLCMQWSPWRIAQLTLVLLTWRVWNCQPWHDRVERGRGCNVEKWPCAMRGNANREASRYLCVRDGMWRCEMWRCGWIAVLPFSSSREVVSRFTCEGWSVLGPTALTQPMISTPNWVLSHFSAIAPAATHPIYTDHTWYICIYIYIYVSIYCDSELSRL